MTPSETYAAHLDAVQEQNARLYGLPSGADLWGGASARQFRFDPRRELDRNMGVIASYIQPYDVMVDVGGGAGRVCLPLALRCKEVFNIEPSPGMGAEFESLAQEAGITNARLVAASLAEAQAPKGDIAFTADVTYFVRDITDFIRQLEAAAARRVMITIWSYPSPNRRGKLFEMVYGEGQAVLPGQAQLAAGAVGHGDTYQRPGAAGVSLVGERAAADQGRGHQDDHGRPCCKAREPGPGPASIRGPL